MKAYPTGGVRKFLFGGKSAVMAETPPLQPYEARLDRFDLVILGFPVWAGNLTPPIRTFLKENDLSGRRVAAFACQSGAGAEKAFGRLRACLGRKALDAEMVLIDPLSRPDRENERRIETFCKALERGRTEA